MLRNCLVSVHLYTWWMLRNWTSCTLVHMVDVHLYTWWIPPSVNTLVKGKVNAALYDYLYRWLWRYSHIPHDLNVNECMTKLGHLAGNMQKVSRKRLVAPPLLKSLKSDNSDEPFKNPEPCFCSLPVSQSQSCHQSNIIQPDLGKIRKDIQRALSVHVASNIPIIIPNLLANFSTRAGLTRVHNRMRVPYNIATKENIAIHFDKIHYQFNLLACRSAPSR